MESWGEAGEDRLGFVWFGMAGEVERGTDGY